MRVPVQLLPLECGQDIQVMQVGWLTLDIPKEEENSHGWAVCTCIAFILRCLIFSLLVLLNNPQANS